VEQWEVEQWEVEQWEVEQWEVEQWAVGQWEVGPWEVEQWEVHKGRHLMSEEVGDERDAGCKQGNSVIGILWLEGSCDGWQRGMGDSEQVSK
jgi:hypothetical protein